MTALSPKRLEEIRQSDALTREVLSRVDMPDSGIGQDRTALLGHVAHLEEKYAQPDWWYKDMADLLEERTAAESEIAHIKTELSKIIEDKSQHFHLTRKIHGAALTEYSDPLVRTSRLSVLASRAEPAKRELPIQMHEPVSRTPEDVAREALKAIRANPKERRPDCTTPDEYHRDVQGNEHACSECVEREWLDRLAAIVRARDAETSGAASTDASDRRQ